MSLWRRKALETFPDLAREISDPSEVWSVMSMWFFLLPFVREAHAKRDEDRLIGLTGAPQRNRR